MFIRKLKFPTILKNSFNSVVNLNSKKFKVYTKTGDKGTTALIGGIRKDKDDEIFDILGDIDELNSYIGLCNAYLSEGDMLFTPLNNIQNHLYHISSYIASSENEKYLKDPTYEVQLESLIDKMDEILPPLKNFINPGGSIEAAHLQIARAISRRVERRYITYSKEKSKIYLKFFNRLSDFFFVASRYTNHVKKMDDKLAK